MTADVIREFVFTTHLDDASLPLLRTALEGAMTAYGINEEKATEAAEIVTNHLSGLAMPEEPTELQFALQYDGCGGSFTINANDSLDLSGLRDAIAQSRAWNAHAHCRDDSANATVIVIELKKE